MIIFVTYLLATYLSTQEPETFTVTCVDDGDYILCEDPEGNIIFDLERSE